MVHLNKNTILIAASGFIFAAALLFLVFGERDAREPGALTSSGELASGPAVGRDLLVILAKLKTTRLDTALFSDPVFLSLRDFGVAIASQPIGRRNPFAPFEEKSAAYVRGVKGR